MRFIAELSLRRSRNALSLSRVAALAAVAAALIAASVESASARCMVQRFNFRLDSSGPWPAFMQADSGKPCRSGYRSRGNVFFERLNTKQEPANGRIELIEGGRFRYISKAGFKGPDSFVLEICGKSRDRPGCTDIKYTVNVN